MPTQNITIWTCSRCGATTQREHGKSDPLQPGGWIGIYASPDNQQIRILAGQKLLHLCSGCTKDYYDFIDGRAVQAVQG